MAKAYLEQGRGNPEGRGREDKIYIMASVGRLSSGEDFDDETRSKRSFVALEERI